MSMDKERIQKLILGEAADYVGELPVAEEHDAAAVVTDTGETFEVEGYRAIKNVTDGEYVAYVTEKYQLVQHRTFFTNALAAIMELDLDVAYVKVVDGRERVDMEVVPGFSEDIRGEDVAMGIRFSNSIDASISARVSAYGLRLVCTNGMMGRTLFGGRSMRHVGENIRVENLADEIEEIVPLAKDNLATIIRKAQDTEVLHAETVLKRAGFGGDYQEEITGRFQGNDRWDLYCTATEVIDHDHRDVKEATRENLHRRADKILPKAR